MECTEKTKIIVIDYTKERENLRNITDNKKFWTTMKPLFGDKGGARENIVLVEKEKIISDNSEVAQEFNNFFESTVDTLGIVENTLLLNNHRIIGSNKCGVENAISKFETHPSILSIKENVKVDCKSLFLLSQLTR